jgi:D-inositol-3-phosphate glycosyltransferase
VMRSVDVVVNASPNEPFGRTIIEALASGTPVVAVRTGGAVDIVDDNVNGLLVRPSDPQDLASALRLIIQDEATRRRLTSEGLVRAERFRLRHIAVEVAQLYRGCLRPRAFDRRHGPFRKNPSAVSRVSGHR